MYAIRQETPRLDGNPKGRVSWQHAAFTHLLDNAKVMPSYVRWCHPPPVPFRWGSIWPSFIGRCVLVPPYHCWGSFTLSLLPLRSQMLTEKLCHQQIKWLCSERPWPLQDLTAAKIQSDTVQSDTARCECYTGVAGHLTSHISQYLISSSRNRIRNQSRSDGQHVQFSSYSSLASQFLIFLHPEN